MAAPLPGFGPPVAYDPAQPMWHSPAPGSLRPPSHVASFTPIPTVGAVRGLGTALIGLLGLYALSVMARGAIAGVALLELGSVDSTADTASIGDYGDLKFVTSAAEGFETLLAAALSVVWVIWFRRTRSNAEAFAPGRVRHSLGMAAGSWFIPVVCLYMPKQISNDIWTATTGRLKGAERWLLSIWWWWWNLYILVCAKDWFVGSWYDKGKADDAWNTVIDSIGACFSGVVCVALAILVVKRLTSHQQARFEETRGSVRS